MRLKSVVIWALVLMMAFAVGFFAMRLVLNQGNSAVQDQNAPGIAQ